MRVVRIGQFTENVTYSDSVKDLESGKRTPASSKYVVYASGKRKTKGSETEAESVLRPKIVAFEIGDGSSKECVAFRSEIGRVNAGKSCLSSDCADRTLS